jgi:hypothetical protein
LEISRGLLFQNKPPLYFICVLKINIKQIINPKDKISLDNIAIISIETHNSNIVEINKGKLKNISSLPIS